MIFEESKAKPETEQKPQEQQMILPNDLRILGLYGEVEEGKALHAISFLIDYSENS